MSNNDKAKEITKKFGFGSSVSPYYTDRLYDAALEAMEWKQSEIEQWLWDNIYDYLWDDDDNTTCIDIQKLINDLRKTY